MAFARFAVLWVPALAVVAAGCSGGGGGGGNDPVVTVDDAATTLEETPVDVDVISNDTDPDDDAVTVESISDGAGGTAIVLASGEVRYTPDAGFNGTDQIFYQATDGGDETTQGTLTVTVTPVNDAPIAVEDDYSIAEDALLTIGAAGGVLGSDVDVDSPALTAVLVTDAANGALALASDGSFTYQPGPDFTGADTFTYHANDGALVSQDVSVTIDVTPVADAPVGVADAYSTDEDVMLTVGAAAGVLDNDTDAEGDTLAAELVTDVASGTLALATDGSFTYLPAANFAGFVTFTYLATDGALDSSAQTVTLTVDPVNDAPVAVADAESVDEDGTLTVPAPGVLGNDTDDDGDALIAQLVSGVTNGVLALGTDGSFVYTPAAQFSGTDSFTYEANDGTTDSGTVTVTLTVNPVADAPVAAADSYSTDEDTTLAEVAPGVLANDTDADGDTVRAFLVSGVSDGTLTLATNGSFTYVPDADFSGADSFTYEAIDAALSSGSVTVTITVNPVNDVPAGAADIYGTSEDTPLAVSAPGVLANDTDVEGPTLSVLDVDVANGSLVLGTDGSFTYTPDPDYSGPDSFEYHVSDGLASSAPVTVTLAVTGVPDAPIAGADDYATEGTLAVFAFEGVLLNDGDPDGDPVIAQLVTGVSNGVLTLQTDGSFAYTPDAGFEGDETFTYQAFDGALSSAPATVTIDVVLNDAPVGVADGYAAAEDTPLLVDAPGGVLANDTDEELDPLEAQLVTGVSNGTLTLQSSGAFAYTPNAEYSGPDSFTYQAFDGALLSDPTTVSITVAPVDDPPVAAPESYPGTEDGIVTVPAPGILANDSDIDSASLIAILVSDVANGTLALATDGSFTYTPNVNFVGADTFTYSANDGNSSSSPATVTIDVSLPTCAAMGSDPLFADQWHLSNTAQSGGTAGQDADVLGAWAACIRGEGTVIAVVDDGLEIAHEDLAANVLAGGSHNYGNGSTDPTGNNLASHHGTAVAGVAAARDSNGLGVRGVAPRANLVGYNLIAGSNGTAANQADAMVRGSGIVDVSNNSWGPQDGTGQFIGSSALWQAAVLQELDSGRDGLGTVYMWAGGNGMQADNDNSNLDGYANFYGVNAICAVDHDGQRAVYSEIGANLLVCAPSEIDFTGIAMTTTDRTGNAGYDNTSYTNGFNGTSGATPVVAGVAALMIDENPTLTWRDVRWILAETARQTDPTHPEWVENGAGYFVNHHYGFGTVDASSAVAAAHTWANLPPRQEGSTGVITVNTAIPDNDPAGVSNSVTITGALFDTVEAMEIYFRSDDHTWASDLEIVLINETTGTESVLAQSRNCGGCSVPAGGWFFSSTRHLGEDVNATWTLRVRDTFDQDVGTFESWGINFYGY